MKNTIIAVFALALVVMPGLVMASTTFKEPYLSCVSDYPQVTWGNAGRFHVVTNVTGPFTWVADDEDYSVRDIGSQFVTPLTRLGKERVTVVWGSKRASCTVQVVEAPGYGEPYLGSAFNTQPALTVGSGPNVTLTAVKYPHLPNTGFEPQTLAGFAFAAALLLAFAIAFYPHAKKAFAIL